MPYDFKDVKSFSLDFCLDFWQKSVILRKTDRKESAAGSA